MGTRPRPFFGPFARQAHVWAGVFLLVWLGRWIQGGDRPIALPFRLLYAAAILGGVVYVVQGFATAFPTLYAGYRRVSRRASRRRGLAIYLSIVALVCLSAPLAAFGRDLGVLVDGGEVGIVGFPGDNSDKVKGLLVTSLLLYNVASLCTCFALDRRRRSRRIRSTAPA